MQSNKILLLGATGNTGRKLLNMALERGYIVRALVRDPAGLLSHVNLEVVQGDVLDSATVKEAVQGVDAVVSCLGIRKANPSDPFSELLSPEDFTEQSAVIVVKAMKDAGVHRLVAISSAGVGDSWSLVAPNMQKVIEGSSVGKIFRDLNNLEKVLEQSGLDTLAVRPVVLVDAELSETVVLADRFDPSTRISNADVARWILDAIERENPFAHRSEMICSPALSQTA